MALTSPRPSQRRGGRCWGSAPRSLAVALLLCLAVTAAVHVFALPDSISCRRKLSPRAPAAANAAPKKGSCCLSPSADGWLQSGERGSARSLARRSGETHALWLFPNRKRSGVIFFVAERDGLQRNSAAAWKSRVACIRVTRGSTRRSVSCFQRPWWSPSIAGEVAFSVPWRASDAAFGEEQPGRRTPLGAHANKSNSLWGHDPKHKVLGRQSLFRSRKATAFSHAALETGPPRSLLFHDAGARKLMQLFSSAHDFGGLSPVGDPSDKKSATHPVAAKSAPPSAPYGSREYRLVLLVSGERSLPEVQSVARKYYVQLLLVKARHIRVFYRGLRALASEIKKQTTAHLVEITFAAMPAVVHSLKVRMQTDSSVLRYLLVRITKFEASMGDEEH